MWLSAISTLSILAASGQVALVDGVLRRGRAHELGQELPLSQAEVRAASRIMDTTNPFPTQIMQHSTPLAWRVASALGRATSLHPSCVFVHLLILVATTLSAVQVRYGGILGRFCNLLMVQHGAPGEGKSVALWLSLQIMYYYDMVREKWSKKAYHEALQAFKDWKEAGEQGQRQCEPQKPAEKDSVFNKGTFTGLGTHMHVQDGCAYLALHEGKSWLPHTFDNAPGGGIDDLNQIHDHDLYKNHPGNTTTRFLVRNPHLCGAVMMHLEEIFEQALKPDSTAGMMRFLIARFPVIINKILPHAPPEQIRSLLEDDADYFNDLDYDNVVQAMGNVMLVASRLYQKGIPRPGEANDKSKYSKVTGLHIMQWDQEVRDHFRNKFNEMADIARLEARESQPGQDTNTRKDMTRLLQFLPPIDVIEKVMQFLLRQTDVTEAQMAAMSGEDLVVALASVDIDAVVQALQVSEIPGKVTAHAVDAAVALGGWFATSYKMAMDARGLVKEFNTDRAAIARMPPASISTVESRLTSTVAALVNPMKTLSRFGQGWDFKSFALNPFTLVEEIHAVQIDCVILSMMGLLAFDNSKIQMAAHARDGEDFVRAANRMIAWDASVDLVALRNLVPEERGAAVSGDQAVADEICRSLKMLMDGQAVDIDRLKQLENTSSQPLPTTGVSASQVVAPAMRAPAAASPSAGSTGAGGLTQVEERDVGVDDLLGLEEHEQPPAKRLKLRGPPPFKADDFKAQPSLNKRILLSALKSAQTIYTASKNKASFTSSATPAQVSDGFTHCFNFLTAAGLATRSGTAQRVSLVAPPAEHLQDVCNKLQEVLQLSAAVAQQVSAAIAHREQAVSFDMPNFNTVLDSVKDVLQ